VQHVAVQQPRLLVVRGALGVRVAEAVCMLVLGFDDRVAFPQRVGEEDNILCIPGEIAAQRAESLAGIQRRDIFLRHREGAL
jgi:hypothetical protein